MPKAEVIKQPIEKVGKSFKQSAWMSIFESFITIVLGIFLVVWGDIVIKIVTCVAGVFLVIKGAYQIINYFIVKGQNDLFNNSLLAGIISLLLGIIAIVMGDGVASIFRIAIGIWIIYESLVHMGAAIKLHAAELDTWRYLLLLSIVMLAVGVFVTFFEGAIATLIGWMMILGGIIGAIGDVMFIQHVDTLVSKLTGEHK